MPEHNREHIGSVQDIISLLSFALCELKQLMKSDGADFADNDLCDVEVPV
jgi:hypothetical protein